MSGGTQDTTPPTVSLTFPANNATVSGTVTLSATASDDTSVSKVEFSVDSTLLGTGNQSGQAGPYTLMWDSTTVANGSHTITAKATDSAGNTASATNNITVNQTAPAFTETFSGRDGTDYFDNSGWTASGFTSNALNHSTGPAGSQSTFGYASSGISCNTGNKTQTLSRSVVLGNNPKLDYWRQLNLQAQVNLSTTASFSVKVNGTAVDSKSVTYANYSESSWTHQQNIDLSAYANQTVTLTFEVDANSNVCLEVFSKAWIDDITISNPTKATDTTPPTVSVTAPANNSTVSGTVTITATASDNTSVSKVEFYIDGKLLSTATASPYSANWDTTKATNASHNITAKAYDPAGNVGTDNSVNVTVNNSGGGSTSVNITDTDANDGYVKANADGSGATVGTLKSSLGLAMGRGSDGMFNRTVLSFDTSGIPTGATVTSANITVQLNSISGDPWADPAGNTLVIDANSACFGACTIEAGDWSATATASAVASVVKWTSGSQDSGTFNASGLSAINKGGTTQLKLRFTLNQTAMNYIFISHGTAVLHITYH